MIERFWVRTRGQQLLGAVLFGLALAGLSGCTEAHDVDALAGNSRDGGDGDDEGSGNAGSAGRDSTAGRGGSGGSTGSSGSGSGGSSGRGGGAGRGGAGRGGAGNSGGGQPVFGNVSSCAPCSGSTGMSGDLAPCCTADGACGLDVSPFTGRAPTCVRQNAPGADSMTCPTYTFGGNFALTSCCGTDGLCGIRIMQTAPLGCVDPAHLGNLVAADRPTAGGRQSCNSMVD